MQYSNEFGRARALQPQAGSYTFQSSTVTYGGPNGAYYTSSTTRRTGGDGVSNQELFVFVFLLSLVVLLNLC